MPHFSAKGNDTYICQKCARIYDSVDHPSVWVEGKGNVCPNCDKPISLTEHCSRESGFPIGSRQLTDYINRHYGHG